MKINDNPPEIFLSRRLFLQFLGFIYLVAFASIGSQILGLVGSNGILPVQSFLLAVKSKFGSNAFWYCPTIFWISATDSTLQLICYLGVLLSCCLIVGVMPVPLTIVLWAFYLSILSVGRDFLSFQWDILLLEVGFLSIFFAPLILKPSLAREAPPSRWILWLFRWLLFKLMLLSGLVKILSQDPSWRNFTALVFHYETQPLPVWISWYVHQLPTWFHKLSCGLMFFVEIVIPFFIFGPRRFRHGAGVILIVFQLFIMLTGNYCFFNLLTIALCLLLFEDPCWPRSIQEWLTKKRKWSTEFPLKNLSNKVILPVAVLLFVCSLTRMINGVGVPIRWPIFLEKIHETMVPFHLTNNYGLFAVMTTTRSEIAVEGSNDGKNWERYEFKWKPGDRRRHPQFVEPHQPRLDWQMWFAALGSYRQNPWFVNFCVRLLEGSPPVLKLLKFNPFPMRPPLYIRAVVEDYRFTNWSEKREFQTWWKAEEKGLYLPPVGLKAE